MAEVCNTIQGKSDSRRCYTDLAFWHVRQYPTKTADRRTCMQCRPTWLSVAPAMRKSATLLKPPCQFDVPPVSGRTNIEFSENIQKMSSVRTLALIVDELYGYNQVLYSGYLSILETEDLVQMDISIYFTGKIIYDTKE